MDNFDLSEFLERRYYAYDFQVIVGDVEDYLDISEKNVDWQYKVEMQKIKNGKDVDGAPNNYRDDLAASVEHRFKVSLPMRIRFAALISLVTAVELEVRILRKAASFEFKPKPKGINETVHILRCFNDELSLCCDKILKEFENLVQVRNVIAHYSGIVSGYEFEHQLRKDIASLAGFSIRNWHYIGETIQIERDALVPLIIEIRGLLPRLWEVAVQQNKVNIAAS